MRKLGIVLGILAVAAFAGSAHAFVITNVTNGEVVFQAGYETATVGENVQTDTPEIGTYNFMGWWSPAPGQLGDSQVHHWVEDEASTGVAAYYGQQYHRVEPAGNPRPYAAAFFDGTPGVEGDLMRIEFAILSISEWPGIRLSEEHETDMTSAPPYPKSIGSLWFTGPDWTANWGAGWTDVGAAFTQADGYEVWLDAHTPGEWNEVVMEYVNGSTDMDVTINDASHTFTNMKPGILNYVAFGAGYNNCHGYLDAVGGASELMADFNNDGVIDDLDLTILANNWDTCGKTHEEGDANDDGCVDDLDLTALANEWPSGDLDVSAVPEPAMLSLLALGGLAALRRRRR